MTSLEIPQHLLVYTFKPEEARIDPAMVEWMHDNASESFRFVRIEKLDEATRTMIPAGFNLLGNASDLLMFRIKFGF